MHLQSEEILEVYELTSIRGIYAIEFGVTILAEELENRPITNKLKIPFFEH